MTNPTISVYLAGKFTARERLIVHRDNLRARGWNVSSHWMDDPEDKLPLEERAVREAMRDLTEVTQAGLIVLDTLDESNTGGREVELGFAMCNGAEVWLVGPTRNIFHYLIAKKYATWDELYADLD